jgi:ketopantoate reductase
MKIAVIGAGAMGSFLAARLASSGEDVTVVDRGETLAAIKTNGLTLIETDGTRSVWKFAPPRRSPTSVNKRSSFLPSRHTRFL